MRNIIHSGQNYIKFIYIAGYEPQPELLGINMLCIDENKVDMFVLNEELQVCRKPNVSMMVKR